MILFASNLLLNEILHPRIRSVGAGLFLAGFSSYSNTDDVGQFLHRRDGICLDFFGSRGSRLVESLVLAVRVRRLDF